MIYYKFLFILLFAFTCHLTVQACDCLKMDVVSKKAQATSVELTVRVKNTCNRRMWLYSHGFWIGLTDQEKTSETSMLHKLTNNSLPEFLLFKWMEEKNLVFKTDITHPGKMSVSYANTDHVYPARLFGSATFKCELSVPGT